ncbi:hypothetical protein LEP1GSC018_2403 [Leptospira kirschneri str. 2008720114]|nr:hypothetical protein LEP1GSC018_2403 [Leptospira kirschneri str. 2008720114]
MKIVSENEWTILQRFRNSQKMCLIQNYWFLCEIPHFKF